jgi:ankyrin repeat protein
VSILSGTLTGLTLEQKLELACCKGETALHKAARYARLAATVTLLKNGCSIDAVDHLGMTSLHWATLNGNAQLTRLFLLHQADITIRDSYAGGMTAWEIAELMGHKPVLAIMKKYRWASE